MTAKKTDYIIIYSFLCASILCIALLARLFVVMELQMDEFSGLVAFIVACLLLGGIYFSFQSILNDCLLPVVERIFRKQKQETFELSLDIVPTPPVETVVQQEEVALPKYDDYKHVAQQKVLEEQQRILNNVLCYTGQELALYMEQNEMQKLYEHIRFFQYATKEECQGIKPSVTVNSKLRPIDLMHFGWNVGNQFKKSGIETATFIKRVFSESLNDSETSTLKRKLRVEGTCIIKIKEEL